jgi:hypothetical protein
MKAALKRMSLGVVLGVSLAGCGGGGKPDLEAFVPPSDGGIWHGTDSISGEEVYGIVAEDGTFRFIRADQVQYAGKATIDKTGVVASFQGFTGAAATFPDGSTHGTGQAAGRLEPNRTMNLSTVFVTDAANAEPQTGTLNLTYDRLYEEPSALYLIGGNFLMNADKDVFSIASDGQVFAQLTASQCVLTGTVTALNARYNVYSMSLTYSSCAGASAHLNGLAFTGLVTLDSRRSPERLIGALSSGPGEDGITFAMDRV